MTKLTRSGWLSGACATLAILSTLGACSSSKTTPATDGSTTTADGAATTTTVDAAKAADSAATTPDTAASAGDTAGSTGDAAGAAKLASSTGAWVIFPQTTPAANPDAAATAAANPAMNVAGTIDAFDAGGGKTRFVLNVTGLTPNMEFGSHLHKLACADTMAGGHYQNVPPTGDAGPATVASPTNEIWLDFTTNAAGAGTATTTVDWKPRTGEAKAIVIHVMRTADGGVAGSKLACVSMVF